MRWSVYWVNIHLSAISQSCRDNPGMDTTTTSPVNLLRSDVAEEERFFQGGLLSSSLKLEGLKRFCLFLPVVGRY